MGIEDKKPSLCFDTTDRVQIMLHTQDRILNQSIFEDVPVVPVFNLLKRKAGQGIWRYSGEGKRAGDTCRQESVTLVAHHSSAASFKSCIKL